MASQTKTSPTEKDTKTDTVLKIATFNIDTAIREENAMNPEFLKSSKKPELQEYFKQLEIIKNISIDTDKSKIEFEKAHETYSKEKQSLETHSIVIQKQREYINLHFKLEEAKNHAESLKYYDTRWNNRCLEVVKMINESNADIICLQELQNLETSKYDLKTFLAMLLPYDNSYTYYCEYKDAFALAILYKRSKVTSIAFDIFHYETDMSNTLVCYGIKFKYVGNDKTFWIYNTHWSTKSQRRDSAVTTLTNKFKDFKEPLLILGDFNMFKKEDGDKQRDLILKWSEDLAYPLTNASGTFYGYIHDDYNYPINNMARLDHIFSKFFTKVGNAIAVGVSQELLQKRAYPSDHLMIMVECVPNYNFKEKV